MRVLVVWCPDWSVVAALEEAGGSPRSPAAVLSRQRRRGVQRPGPRRGRTPRASAVATPRPAAPSCVLLPANPDRDARAFEPVLASGRGAASRRGVAAPRAARRPRPGPLVRRRADAAATVVARPWSRPGSGTAGSASPTTCSPPSRPPAAPTCRAGGGAAGRLRAVPARAAGRGARGRRPRRAASWSACCGGSGCAPSATSPPCPATPSLQRFGALRRRVWRRARGEDPALFAARTPPPELERRGRPSSRRWTRSRRSASACARPPSGSSPSWPPTSSSPPGCGSRPSPTAWCARRAPGCTRATSPPATWSTGCTGSCSRPASGGSLRARKDSGDGAGAGRAGAVRARGGRARRRPRRGAVGRRVRRAGGARRRPGAGDGRLRRRAPPGAAGRPQPRRPGRRWCRGASAPSACARSTGRGRAGCPGPAPVRVFAEPAGRRGRRRRAAARCGVTERGAVTGEPRRFRVGGAASRRRACLAAGRRPGPGPWPVDEAWWSGGAGPVGPLPGGRRRRPRLAAAARADGWSLEAAYD